jgi:2-C-methyl-D-erythritol 4-phosphate cytidylyltransferase
MGPKAFICLGQKTLLKHVVDAFDGVVDEIVVAVSPHMVGEASGQLSNARVIVGGRSRQATVLNLLQATVAGIVIVHDAARPFLERAVIDRTLAAAQRHGAVTAARPVVDSLVDTTSQLSVDREQLRAVQTPQGFRHNLLLQAHLKALEVGYSATDDATLVRRLGHEVTLVEGSPMLMKVTTRQDLDMARILERSWCHADT